jgi:hypothetical protein
VTIQNQAPHATTHAPRPGDFPIGSIESRAVARAMLGASTDSDCICFPADHPPALALSAEREAAKAVQCPVHGTRFIDFAPLAYRPIQQPTHLEKELWSWHSPQYVKAMKASFPADRWPAIEIGETDGSVRFVLKDGTEIHRTQPPPLIYDYETGMPISRCEDLG